MMTDKLRNVCVIGPVPPPMGGDAKAIKTLIDSHLFNEFFTSTMFDISDGTMRSTGKKKLTLRKLKKILQVRSHIKKNIKQKKFDIYYLVIAQSKLGSLRDIIFLKTILKMKSKQSRIIIHLHGGGFKNHYSSLGNLFQKVIKYYFKKIDTAIVLSNSLVSMFDSILPINSIKIVQNCVDNQFLLDENEFKQKWERIAHLQKFNILYLSNMIQSKGYFDVLLAAKLLKDQKNIKFIFAGGFPNQSDKNNFFEFVNEESLLQNVEYVGIVDGIDKLNLLKCSDIFVLPTNFPPEGQPISILEAMSAGMPVITTAKGGIGDIIKNELNGFIISPNNPDLIASSIMKLIENSKLYQEISLLNRKKILDEHLEEKYVKSMIDVFNDTKF